MTPNTKQRVKVIGFGRRFVATVIDGLVILVLSSLIAMGIGVIGVIFGWIQSDGMAWHSLIMLLVLVTSVFYYIGLWTRSDGQTLGKSWLGIQIVPEQGGPISLGKAVVRYLGYLLSGIVASIGFFWVAVDKKRRGWHDLLAGTYVISIRDDMPKSGEVEFEVSDERSGWVWLILWLILAVGVPGALFSSLWFLGPVINRFIADLLSGIG